MTTYVTSKGLIDGRRWKLSEGHLPKQIPAHSSFRMIPVPQEDRHERITEGPIVHRIQSILRGRRESDADIQDYIDDLYSSVDIMDYEHLDAIGVYADFTLWQALPNGFLEVDPKESLESYPNNIIATALNVLNGAQNA